MPVHPAVTMVGHCLRFFMGWASSLGQIRYWTVVRCSLPGTVRPDGAGSLGAPRGGTCGKGLRQALPSPRHHAPPLLGTWGPLPDMAQST